MKIFLMIDRSAPLTAQAEQRRTAAERLWNGLIRKIQPSELSVMVFGEQPRWMGKAVCPGRADWEQEKPCRWSSFASACACLEAALNRQPDGTETAVVLLSDGHFADDYEPVFHRLLQNRAFQRAFRTAVTVGQAPNRRPLAAFAGSPGAVFREPEAGLLADLLGRLEPAAGNCRAETCRIKF